VKYLLTVNGNVFPNNSKLVDHKLHHTHIPATLREPKMAEPGNVIHSVANTSSRKFLAFPFKK